MLSHRRGYFIRIFLLLALPALCVISVFANNRIEQSNPPAEKKVFDTASIEKAVYQISQTLTRPATITIGYDDAEHALKTGNPDIPIIALFLSSTEFFGLLEKYGNTNPITAIFGNPDPRAQVALAEELFPKGINALIETPGNGQIISRISSPNTKVVQADSNVVQLTQQLGGIDVLVALPDPNGINGQNIQHMIRAMFQQRSAVVGYSRKMVEIGCLASIYPRPQSVITTLRSTISSFNKTGVLPKPTFVNDYAIAVNQRLARSLDLVIPNQEQLLRDIDAKVSLNE